MFLWNKNIWSTTHAFQLIYKQIFCVLVFFWFQPRVYMNFWTLKQLNKVIFRRQINPSINMALFCFSRGIFKIVHLRCQGSGVKWCTMGITTKLCSATSALPKWVSARQTSLCQNIAVMDAVFRKCCIKIWCAVLAIKWNYYLN